MYSTHECIYHRTVETQYWKYAVIRYFCICVQQWQVDVLYVDELASEEAIVLTVEGDDDGNLYTMRKGNQG